MDVSIEKENVQPFTFHLEPDSFDPLQEFLFGHVDLVPDIAASFQYRLKSFHDYTSFT
jgi:hypothetical protein